MPKHGEVKTKHRKPIRIRPAFSAPIEFPLGSIVRFGALPNSVAMVVDILIATASGLPVYIGRTVTVGPFHLTTADLSLATDKEIQDFKNNDLNG